MYLPFLDVHTQQALVAFWQPCPLLVNLLWYIFKYAMPPRSEDENREADESRFSVNLIYAITMLASAFAHIATVVACLTSRHPDINLSNVLIPMTRESWNMDQSLHFIFQIDFWFIVAAALVACYTAIWDLAFLGATTVGVWRGVFELSTVAVVLGPGAAVGLGWYWREKGMWQVAEKTKKNM